MKVHHYLSQCNYTASVDPRAFYPPYRNPIILLLFGLLAIAGLLESPAAFAQRNRIASQCNPPPSPTDFDAVYRCFSAGVRISKPQACNNLSTLYLRALRQTNRLRGSALQPYRPSCEILARVQQEVIGQKSYWQACMDTGSIPAEDHLPRCLNAVMAGNKSYIRRLKDCGSVRNTYEKALRATQLDGRLPTAYQPLDCQIAADFLTKITGTRPGWAACFGYEPGKISDHLPSCLGDRMARLNNCKAVKNDYERALKEAYGQFPSNYVTPTCSEIDAVLKAVAEAEEAERQAVAAHQAELRRKQEEERRQKLVAEAAERERLEQRRKMIHLSIAIGGVIALLIVGYLIYGRGKRSLKADASVCLNAIIAVMAFGIKQLLSLWATLLSPPISEKISKSMRESPLSANTEEAIALIVQVQKPIYRARISKSTRRTLVMASLALGLGLWGLTVATVNTYYSFQQWWHSPSTSYRR